MKAFISSRIPEKWLNKIAEKFEEKQEESPQQGNA